MTKILAPAFALFHQEQVNNLDAKGKPRSHFFAATLIKKNGRYKPHTLLDYTGNETVIRDGNRMTNNDGQKADRMVVFPIDRDACLRFQMLGQALNHLGTIGRFPFYFSGELWVVPEQEVAGQDAIDIWGVPAQELDGKNVDFQWSVGDPSNPDTWQRRAHPDGLLRARANCVSMIALFMGLSGIHSWPLDPDLRAGARGYRLRAGTKNLFERCSGFTVRDEKIVSRSVLSDDQVHLRLLETGSHKSRGRRASFMAMRSQKRENVEMATWLSLLSQYPLLNRKQPMTGDADSVPHYMQQEFIAAGLTLKA